MYSIEKKGSLWKKYLFNLLKKMRNSLKKERKKYSKGKEYDK